MSDNKNEVRIDYVLCSECGAHYVASYVECPNCKAPNPEKD